MNAGTDNARTFYRFRDGRPITNHGSVLRYRRGRECVAYSVGRDR